MSNLNTSNTIMVGHKFNLATIYKDCSTFVGNKNIAHIKINIEIDTIINTKKEAHDLIEEYFDEVEKMEKKI